MNDSEVIEKIEGTSPVGKALLIISACLVLVVPLLPIPSPGFVTGQPWKVEFLASLFLIAVIAYLYLCHRRSLFRAFDLNDLRPYSAIIFLLAGFVIWSLVSMFWSVSPRSAAHFGLSMGLYLVVIILMARIKDSQRYAITVLGVTAAIIGLACISDYLTYVDFASVEGTIRIRYAKYAELLIATTPILWTTSVCSGSPRNSRLLLVSGSVGWLAVMLSLSRGAFLSGIAAFVMLFVVTAIFAPHYRTRTLRTAAYWLALTIAVQVFFSFATNVPATTQYVTGQSDPTRSSAHMRIFTWKVARQMSVDNLLTGVGGDNFGVRFNGSRLRYSVTNPLDPDLEIGEDFMFERAHNEPLQIFAELGLIGIAFAAAIAAVFGLWVFRTLRKSRIESPTFIGALAGIAGFAVSSLFSSFSFRALQNGIAFSIVFGLALRYLQKPENEDGESTQDVDARRKPVRAGSFAVGAIVALSLLLFYSAAAGISRIYQLKAERTDDVGQKEVLLEDAIAWDSENAGAFSANAMALAADGKYADAATSLKTAIDLGAAATQMYSIEAGLNIQAGELANAEKAMAEAVAIYPRSVFARVRYAQILDMNGNRSDAAFQIEAARAIDLKQANGWIALINDGGMAAYLSSRNSTDVAAPAELKPPDAVFQFLDRDALTRSSP